MLGINPRAIFKRIFKILIVNYWQNTANFFFLNLTETFHEADLLFQKSHMIFDILK